MNLTVFLGNVNSKKQKKGRHGKKEAGGHGLFSTVPLPSVRHGSLKFTCLPHS